MRSWFGAGMIGLVGAMGVHGSEARSADRPIVLAQIRLNPPSSDGPTKSGTIVTALQASDVAAFFKDAGVKDIETSKEEQLQVVQGSYKGIPIVASLGSRTEAVSGSVILIAYLGKQDAVDQTFMNAFNKNYYVRLLKREDGTIIMKLAADFKHGVTIEYCRGFVNSFVNSIDSAAEYKVE